MNFRQAYNALPQNIKNMITIKDIRINNLVANTGQIFIIKKIDAVNDLIECISLNDNNLYSFHTSDLDYIELTTEWLKRFRFSFGLKSNRKTIYNDGWFSPHIKAKDDQIFKIRLYQDEEGFVFALDPELGITFNYVHEIQNIYRLIAKKELPILDNDKKGFVKML